MKVQFSGGLSLLGRIIPRQITGKDDTPLIPMKTDRSKMARTALAPADDSETNPS